MTREDELTLNCTTISKFTSFKHYFRSESSSSRYLLINIKWPQHFTKALNSLRYNYLMRFITMWRIKLTKTKLDEEVRTLPLLLLKSDAPSSETYGQGNGLLLYYAMLTMSWRSIVSNIVIGHCSQPQQLRGT